MVEQKISLAVQNLNDITVSNRTRNGVPMKKRIFFTTSTELILLHKHIRKLSSLTIHL